MPTQPSYDESNSRLYDIATQACLPPSGCSRPQAAGTTFLPPDCPFRVLLAVSSNWDLRLANRQLLYHGFLALPARLPVFTGLPIHNARIVDLDAEVLMGRNGVAWRMDHIPRPDGAYMSSLWVYDPGSRHYDPSLSPTPFSEPLAPLDIALPPKRGLCRCGGSGRRAGVCAAWQTRRTRPCWHWRPRRCWATTPAGCGRPCRGGRDGVGDRFSAPVPMRSAQPTFAFRGHPGRGTLLARQPERQDARSAHERGDATVTAARGSLPQLAGPRGDAYDGRFLESQAPAR